MARRLASSVSRIVASFALTLACVGCGGSGSEAAGNDATVDTSVDGVADTRTDVADAIADLARDTSPDATRDGSVDTAADLGADTTADVPAETLIETGTDIGVDAGADMSIDTRLEIGVDTGVDTGVDRGVDTSVDTSTTADTNAGVDAADATDATDATEDSPGACTNLSGSITSLAKGRYCVVGDVIVPAGTTLSVPAGTELIFMGRFHFGRDPALADTVGATSGGLSAIGTAAEPIVFRGATTATAWFGIAVSYNPDPVQLEFVTIRDAYKDDHDPNSRIWRRGGGLSSYVNVAGTIIRHSQFINDRAWMVAGALDINSNGSWPSAGPVEISDTLFEDDDCECGVYVGSADDKCGGGAIRFSHVGGPVTITNNVFRHDSALSTAGIDAYGGGVGAFDSQLPLGVGNLFDSNSASAADGAISCAGHPALGVDFTSVDPSNVFTGNTPDIGCGL
ncbi:MAG: hypothetical protein ACHREM_15265 [Polyangiales bacterium]